MNIALLFNSDAAKYNGFYGPPILQAVLGTNIIQASDRHMKMSAGDVLIYGKSKTWEGYDALTEAVYFHSDWSLLLEDRLRATFRIATVYALIFENMTQDIAKQLHNTLGSDDAYLGLLAVDYAYGPHLALFRNSMISRYRILGRSCRIFETMGDEENRDDYEPNELRNLGFTDVDWEDRGAHKTIFDDFDTLEHFEQIKIFRQAVAPFLKGNEDAAYELVMTLEDLNPRLFNALGSSIASLISARNEEHVAQAAVSGRRYLEKLADVLFPPRDGLYGGRKVGQEQFRNRLWAYIGDHASNAENASTLGKEVDRLNSEFSAGVHSDKDKERILRALVDASELTASILALNIEESRKPYFAHKERIQEFWTEVLGQTIQK